LRCERTERGTPLLLACLQAIECRVERVIETGDHRCVIGSVRTRYVRKDQAGKRPHRFGGTTPAWKRWAKKIVYRTRLYDLYAGLMLAYRKPISNEQGTRCQIPEAGKQSVPSPEDGEKP
jgi:hypothetical protein